jgi:histone demethylase
MHQLENNRNLNPDQLHMLNHLKSQFSQTQQHQKQHNLSYHTLLNNNGPTVNQLQIKNIQHRSQNSNGNGVSTSYLDFHTDGLPLDLENVNPTMNSSQDLNMLLSQHDIAEDLRSSDGDKCGLDHILALNSGNKFINRNSIKIQNNNNNNNTALFDLKKSYPIELLKLDASLTMQQEQKISEPQINIEMSSHQIIKACKGFGLNGVQNTSILSPKCVSPSKSSIKSKKQLPIDQLNPITPSVVLESKRDTLSPQLQQYCVSNPISVVRGLAGVLKLDLSLFSTKTLVDTDSDHIVEVRTQRQQASDENWDTQGKQRVWKCESSRSFTTVAKYAQYQAFTFQETLKDETLNKNQNSPIIDPIQTNDYSLNDEIKYNNDCDHQINGNVKSPTNIPFKKFKMIKFCTNVDLSDEKKWKIQLQELSKLPPFMRPISACNMLSHVGHKILGMNTLQLYMKIPGSRTPGHQENNNFCSININIGPGDCEWFGVAQCYWSLIEELCEKNGCDYLTGSWWPKLDELYENNIPVYRFIQKPGDLVWVNSGCVHWVQAIGWCNNIAWNVGPLTYTQYKSAIERYEWNKYKHYKSIVPVLHLTWNIARNIKISDRRLYELIKYVLMQSIKQCQFTINYIENCELDMKLQPRQLNEPAHYCIDCDCEVFNILFVSEQEKKHVVHCQDCARRRNHLLDNFVILYQYTIEELKLIYDQFVLYTPQLNNST